MKKFLVVTRFFRTVAKFQNWLGVPTDRKIWKRTKVYIQSKSTELTWALFELLVPEAMGQ